MSEQEAVYGVISAGSQVRYIKHKEMSRKYGLLMQRLCTSINSYDKPEDFVFTFQQSDVGNLALGDFISLLKEKDYDVEVRGNSYIVTFSKAALAEVFE